MLVGWILLLGQASPGGPPPLDLTVYGVAGVTVSILLALLWSERARATKAEEAIVELARTSAAGLAEATAAIQRSAEATRDLTAEVRGRGR